MTTCFSEGIEPFYVQSAFQRSQHHRSRPNPQTQHRTWNFDHGEQLPKQAGDVLIGEYLHDALYKLNPELTEDSADEVIYKLKGVLLEAKNSGLVRANEQFMEWLNG